MDQHQIELFCSKKSDDWATPDYLYRQLDYEFHFDLDPCPIESAVNGLEIPWNGNVFVNPPYSRTKDFLLKAHQELQGGRAKVVVFLLYACTDTAWFHDLVYGKAEIRFLRGRVAFIGKQSKGHSAMRPSMVCVFRGQNNVGDDEEILNLMVDGKKIKHMSLVELASKLLDAFVDQECYRSLMRRVVYFQRDYEQLTRNSSPFNNFWEKRYMKLIANIKQALAGEGKE